MKPRDFYCPYCKAPIGARCTQPQGYGGEGSCVELTYYHCERVDATFEALAMQLMKVES